MATTELITTAQQLLQATGLGRCELVRGELVMMSPSGAEHCGVIAKIIVRLGTFVEQHALGRILGAEGGFLIARREAAGVKPSFAGSRWGQAVICH